MINVAIMQFNDNYDNVAIMTILTITDKRSYNDNFNDTVINVAIMTILTITVINVAIMTILTIT